MSTLDQTTGLPEIPKGYRWNVQEELLNDYHYYGSFISPGSVGTGRLEVRLESYWTKTWTETVPGFARLPFLARKVERSSEGWSEVASALVEGVHPIGVRNAAHKALKKWNAKRLRESLKGTYPPKKLDVNS